MCGVAAIFSYGPRGRPVQDEQLNRICQRMSCRGPDGAGLWIDGARRVALGHRRLAIIDLSEAGRQPMADPTRSYLISFNGEIYNYRELRRELERKGYAFY